MVSSEKIYDMLPIVVTLYEKLDLDSYKKQIVAENKGKENIDKKDLGTNLFKYIFKNSAKIKEEVFEVVSVFEDKSIEEVKAQSFVKTFNTIKEILQDKELLSFFKQAV